MKFDKVVFWKAVKEPLRLLVLAVLPFAFAYLTELPYSWAAFVLVMLRWLDSYLHELGKAEKNDTLVKGLTRF